MLSFLQTFDTVADLGGFTNEVFAWTTKNARIIRRMIALGMKQIVAISGSLSYKKVATITTIDGQQFYPLPSDCSSVAFATHTNGSLTTPLYKTDETEWAQLNQVSTKSNIATNYRIMNRTNLATNQIGIYPLPSGGTTINVEYISSMQDLDFVGTSDINTLLPLEEGFEMLPVYYALSMILKGREENGIGNDWWTEYSNLLVLYKEKGMNQTENLVVRRRGSTKTTNPNHLIHITW